MVERLARGARAAILPRRHAIGAVGADGAGIVEEGHWLAPVAVHASAHAMQDRTGPLTCRRYPGEVQANR